MTGIAYDRLGDLDVLAQRDDLPDPPVGPDTVLVRLHAADVNPVDLTIREDALAGAFPHRFPIVLGWDAAGTVEAAGPAPWDLAAGDEVFGYLRRDDVQWGTTAELVPALPLPGWTAYQALTEPLEVGEGDRVLVHRASGGVGFNAVQIAVALGALVGAASPRDHGFLRDAGAAEVYGYSAAPLSEQPAEPVDAVLDLVGGDTLADAPRQVRDPTRTASVVDPSVRDLGGRHVFVRSDRHDLEELGRTADAGQLRVPIATAFPFEETAEAQRMVGEGHVCGKVVVTLR